MKPLKKIGLALICAALILIGGILFVFFQPFLASEPGALIEIERGIVEVKKGDAWEPIANNTNLKEGWSIRTSPDSEAEIVFFGSSVARLNENSEINLKEIDEKEKVAYLEQRQGDIWCNVLDAGGISFLIETSEGIFTNEGCIFRVTYTPSAGVIAAGIAAKTASLTQVSVASGFIRMNGKSTDELLGSASKQQLKGRTKAIISSIRTDKKSYTLPSDMTATIKQNKTPTFTSIVLDRWVGKNKAKDNTFVVRRREQFKRKYQYHILAAKTAFPQLTDELINIYLDDILWGKINVNEKIQDGTIPKEYIKFIPSELISKKPVAPVVTDKKEVKPSISSVLPAKLGISSSLLPEERLVSLGEGLETREVDLYISGQGFSKDSYLIFFPGTGIEISHIRVIDSENIAAIANIEKKAVQTGPKAMLLFDRNNPVAQSKLNSAVNIQASLSKEEELKLDGAVLRNKWNKYIKFKSAGNRDRAAEWMLSIMRELDVLPPGKRGGCDDDENRILFGLKQAIMAGAEDIAQSPIPTDTLTVLLEMYKTLANFFDPKTAGGRTTLTNKLQNRGFTLEESQDILDEIGGVYTRLGPLLR